MNNFDLEKLLNENFCDTLNSVEPVKKEKFYKLYSAKPEKTENRKRVAVYRYSLAFALIALLAVGSISVAAFDMNFRDMLAERAKNDNVSMTEEEVNELASAIESTYPDSYDADLEYGGALPEMGENEHGQKYGSVLYGFELVTVVNDYDIQGYVYKEDMEDAMLSGPMAEDFSEYFDSVDEWEEDKNSGKLRNWCYVYDEDGTTVIGKFILAISKDAEEYMAGGPDGIHSNFVTDEELETGKYDKYIYNGFDSEAYEAKAAERTENLLK